MRKRKNKLKMILLITSGIVMSPVIAAGIIKGISSFTAAAAVLSEIKIGEQKCEKDDYTVMLSHGFGWSTGESGKIELNENNGLIPYPEVTEVHSGSVIKQTFGRYNGNQYFDLDKCGQVRNCTEESDNILLAQSRLNPEFEIKLNSTPQVLIMHTHTTESFEPYERDYYDDSFSYRSSDEKMNVAAIGEEMKSQIESYGIKVIHDTTIHDYPSYNGSYERSAETVKKILKENPDIKVVLDIHRDAIASEGDLIAPVTEINGKNAAQIMIVSGCDDGTMNMPDYLMNFRLAAMFQQQIESDSPGITRPLLFDYRNYNQELTTGSLLIEVGSHGNSIDQVRYTGKLIGKSIGVALQKLV